MNNEVQQELLNALIKEKRADRRWRNFRMIIWLVLILLFIGLVFAPKLVDKTPTQPYASLVRLSGPIMPGSEFSARYALPAIKQAFKDKAAKGVILLINSPGGTAAQASIIHDRILELKKQYHKKVIVVAEDALASGAYLVASAADKIFVNRDTLTGSIGVILSGFGFVDTLQKLGITRRVFTAGKNKDNFDPFLALRPEDKEKMDKLLAAVHQGFIQDVLQGRGNRLTGDHATLFSGEFWTGSQAVKLGLADGTETLWSAMQKEFSVKQAKVYRTQPSIFSALFKDIGTELKIGFLTKASPLSEKAF